jgi:carbohydrate-selective porin OprB
VSNKYAATNFNLFNLYLTQKLCDDLVSIDIGQMTVDKNFMGSAKAGNFINSGFGVLPAESGNTIYPLAAPRV